MSKLEKLLEKIPQKYHATAKAFAPILLKWGEFKRIEWMNEFTGSNFDYNSALLKLYKEMTPEQRNAEQSRQIEVLRALNRDNAAAMKLQREAIWGIFFALLDKA